MNFPGDLTTPMQHTQNGLIQKGLDEVNIEKRYYANQGLQTLNMEKKT